MKITEHIIYIIMIFIVCVTCTQLYFLNQQDEAVIKFLSETIQEKDLLLDSTKELQDNQQEILRLCNDTDEEKYCDYIIDNNKIESQYIYSCPHDKFQDILVNVANEADYKINVYDCSEYSLELSNRLNSRGWKSKVKLVTINCNSELFGGECAIFRNNHAIVKLSNIYIEATTGQVILPQEYEDYGIR